MQPRLTGLALLVSLVALGVAAWAVAHRHAAPADDAARLDAIDARLDRLEAAQRAGRERDEATLVGLAADTPATAAGRSAATGGDRGRSPTALGVRDAGDGVAGEAEEQIRELVDEAVEKKAAQIRSMQQKKPSIDVFAKTLGLDPAQRETVAREVVAAQHEIRRILETPTADGTNLLDELVEVMAEGVARPGEKSDRGMKLFGRLLTEEVPGTSETYAAQAERAKDRLRETLRRELTPAQHALFESWQMDPSEIQEIPGSPWKDVEGRVIERAKDLGARIPGED